MWKLLAVSKNGSLQDSNNIHLKAFPLLDRNPVLQNSCAFNLLGQTVRSDAGDGDLERRQEGERSPLVYRTGASRHQEEAPQVLHQQVPRLAQYFLFLMAAYVSQFS